MCSVRMQPWLRKRERAVEQAAVVGVVQIDVLRIVHHELDLAERVGRPRRLAPALDLAVLALDRDVARLARHFLRDARRHFPPRVEDHAGRLHRQLRGRRLGRAGDGAALPARHAVLDQGRMNARHVDDDVAMPRSRGSQRQRSMLSRIVPAAAASLARLSAVLAARHIADGSEAACRASRQPPARPAPRRAARACGLRAGRDP